MPDTATAASLPATCSSEARQSWSHLHHVHTHVCMSSSVSEMGKACHGLVAHRLKRAMRVTRAGLPYCQIGGRRFASSSPRRDVLQLVSTRTLYSNMECQRARRAACSCMGPVKRPGCLSGRVASRSWPRGRVLLDLACRWCGSDDSSASVAPLTKYKARKESKRRAVYKLYVRAWQDPLPKVLGRADGHAGKKEQSRRGNTAPA